jgi:hypothetical protein
MMEEHISVSSNPANGEKRLGLDPARSWILVDQATEFEWPGFDLRMVPGTDSVAYGFLPPGLFKTVMQTTRAWLKRFGIIVTPR